MVPMAFIYNFNQHMIRYNCSLILVSLICLISLASCNSGDVVLFSVEDDKGLGLQVAKQVDSTYRSTGKLLERDSAKPTVKAAYSHLDKILNRVLNSGKIKHRDEFDWTIKIIDDKEVLNAFATPGGYIYVYTGLLKFLENEDHLAGVLAHEIAHADQRHSVKQLQRNYGISLLLSIILGSDSGVVEQIAGQIAGTLAGLQFSRSAETEADAYSVTYLSGTDYYACNGAAGFFVKLNAEAQQGNPPEFLSTHPNPDNRIIDIEKKAEKRNCAGNSASDKDLKAIKRALNL
jgi:beta-barrel assembly-enhancing protease